MRVLSPFCICRGEGTYPLPGVGMLINFIARGGDRG